MHRYEVASMMNEKRLTNSFKSYIGLDDDEQVKYIISSIIYFLFSLPFESTTVQPWMITIF